MKAINVHANGLSNVAIQWVFETHKIFVLDLVGKSYSIVKEVAEELISQFPNEIFEVEFSNGDIIKSANFPQEIKLEKCF